MDAAPPKIDAVEPEVVGSARENVAPGVRNGNRPETQIELGRACGGERNARHGKLRFKGSRVLGFSVLNL